MRYSKSSACLDSRLPYGLPGGSWQSSLRLDVGDRSAAPLLCHLRVSHVLGELVSLPGRGGRARAAACSGCLGCRQRGHDPLRPARAGSGRGLLQAAAKAGADPPAQLCRDTLPLAAKHPLFPSRGQAGRLERDFFSIYKRIHNCEGETKTFLKPRGQYCARGTQGTGEGGRAGITVAEPGVAPLAPAVC